MISLNQNTRHNLMLVVWGLYIVPEYFVGLCLERQMKLHLLR